MGTTPSSNQPRLSQELATVWSAGSTQLHWLHCAGESGHPKAQLHCSDPAAGNTGGKQAHHKHQQSQPVAQLQHININQLSADRGSADEAGAPRRSFKDLQLPRNQSTPVTNSGHDVSAKPQGILLRISNSRIRLGSISLHHGADMV